jgi:hypothetical protein
VQRWVPDAVTAGQLPAYLCARNRDAGLPGLPLEGAVIASSSTRLTAGKPGVPTTTAVAFKVLSEADMMVSWCLNTQHDTRGQHDSEQSSCAVTSNTCWQCQQVPPTPLQAPGASCWRSALALPAGVSMMAHHARGQILA